MKIAVLSGKGGAGKTFVAVNLSYCAQNAVYVDCDVEEPNGRLFLKPQNTVTEEVYKLLPSFDRDKCTGCRKCVDFCKFNALVFIKNKPVLFSDVCHSCMGCKIVCPSDAVGETRKPIGMIEEGSKGQLDIVTGILNLGESSGVPIIKKALEKAFSKNKTTIVDCPPGSACSVMESVNSCDYCILVVEPTAFGFHNFKMVYELVTLLNKKCGIVINRSYGEFKPLDDFCSKNQIPVLLKIPYSKDLAYLTSEGKIAAEENEGIKEIFTSLLEKTGGSI